MRYRFRVRTVKVHSGRVDTEGPDNGEGHTPLLMHLLRGDEVTYRHRYVEGDKVEITYEAIPNRSHRKYLRQKYPGMTTKLGTTVTVTM